MSLQTLEAARGLLERELAAALDRLRGQDEQHRSALRVAAQAQEELQRKVSAPPSPPSLTLSGWHCLAGSCGGGWDRWDSVWRRFISGLPTDA